MSREFTKHTVTIYSPPVSGIELSALVREAEDGEAICTDYAMEAVTADQLPEAAASFFDVLDEEDEGPALRPGIRVKPSWLPGPTGVVTPCPVPQNGLVAVKWADCAHVSLEVGSLLDVVEVVR